MSRRFPTLLADLAVYSTLALAPAAPAVAQQVSFTVTGAINNTGQGYTAGQPVTLRFVLDAAAARMANASPVPVCCGGTLSWQQNLFTGEPQLWSSVSGTGLSGAWLPPTDADTGSLALAVSTPSLGSNSFQMGAFSQIGFPSGLFANGLSVSGLQVSAVFLGLNAVDSYGVGKVFSPIAPDPTPMFLSMAGTYFPDRIFSDLGSIWTSGPNSGQSTFRVDQLTIAAVVPEPSSALLLAVGCAALVWLIRYRRAAEI